MSVKRIERRLVALGRRLAELRAEQAVCDAQLVQLADEADDARVRALVSDGPLDRQNHRDAARSADTLARRRREVSEKIADLQRRQDELLDQLASLRA